MNRHLPLIHFNWTIANNLFIDFRFFSVQKNLVNQRWLIEPAYTWHQPFSLSKHGLRTRLLDMVSIDAATEAKPTLHRLTDECLDEIFKRCELRSLVNLFQVCRRFRNQFLRPDGHLSSRYFRKFRTIRIDACGIEMKTYDSVGMARKCLRRAGPFVQKVVFCCDDLHHACVPSYLKKIDQYAGDQFSELELIDVVITQDNLQFFKPLLYRIRVLRINDMTRSSTYASDWNTICPNLETLEIKRNGLPLRMNVALSWWSTPILKSLSVDFDLSLSLQAIIFRCQQLEHFKFKCHRNGSLNLLPALRNIRHLEIEDVKSLRLVNFSGFLQLKQLTLKFLNSHYDQIIATINGPTELRELKLMTFRAVAHEPALISLIKRLPDLEILYLYGISIERTAVINILRHAVNLKAFHFSHFDGHFDRSLIAEIVSICEIEQRQKPIELFISKTIKHRDLAALIDSNDQRFVRIQLEGLNYYIA